MRFEKVDVSGQKDFFVNEIDLVSGFVPVIYTKSLKMYSNRGSERRFIGCFRLCPIETNGTKCIVKSGFIDDLECFHHNKIKILLHLCTKMV